MATFADNLARFVDPRFFNPEFNQQSTNITPTLEPDIRTQTPELDIEGIFNERYQPQSAMQDQFRNIINEYPIRDKPSFGQKLVASLAGFGGGPQAARESLDAPFRESVADWKLKADASQAAASQEIAGNRERASAVGNEVKSLLNQQQMDIRQQQTNVNLGRLQNEMLKNDRIYETTILRLQQQIAESDNKLRLAAEKFQFEQGSFQAQMNFRNAQLEATNARAAAELAQAKYENAQLVAHRAIQERQADERNRIAAILASIRGDELDFRKEPTNVEDKLTTDSQGNVTGRTRTTTRGPLKPQSSHSNTQEAPKAPAGWKYVRNSTNTGWTAVKDDKK